MKKFLLAVLLILFFLLPAFYSTYPLYKYFIRGIPYAYKPLDGKKVAYMQSGDHLQLFYTYWLFKDSIAGNIPFFSDPYQFSTPQEPIRFSIQGFPISIIFAIFSVFGDPFAYNTLIILTYAAAGISMFLLVKKITNNTWGALIGGYLFAFAPYRVAQLLAVTPTASPSSSYRS